MIVIEKDQEKFNFRVAAIILNKNNSKVLIHRKKGQDLWMLPGGRMEMGEDTSVGIKRELEEELGIKENVKIKYIIEDFFELGEMTYHELCFYYKVNLNPDKYNMPFNEEFAGTEGENFIFKWINIEEVNDYNLKPEFLKDKIKNCKGNVQHVIIDER